MTVSSVLQLGRYKIGDTAWVLALHANEPDIPEEDEWMINEHPRYLYETHWHSLWPQGVSLPRLESIPFRHIAWLLTSKIEVVEFVISSIIREHGEYFYFNDNIIENVVPEFALFDSKEAARMEQTRILKTIKKWVDQQIQ